jgi:ATP-dependent Clp protease ATP-binding subunit ClpC
MSWFKSLWKTAVAPLKRDRMEYLNNLTPRAQQALTLARKEAARFNQDFVGTQHVLLGLIKLGQGLTVALLDRMGVNLETARLEVAKRVGSGGDRKPPESLPYSPRVKQVLALAAKEANQLNHSYLGTEHLLLGLLNDEDGSAGLVLKNLGVDLEKMRRQILRELDTTPSPPAKDNATPQNAGSAQSRANDTSERDQ